MKSVYQTVFAKLFSMFLGVSSGVFITRLIIQELGTGPFALYALLTTIPALLPFLDLGTGAVIVNSVSSSRDPKNDLNLSRTIASVLRIATASATVLLAVNLILFLSGQWGNILGPSTQLDGRELTVFLCITIFAAGIPLSLGQRVLLGSQKYHVQVLLQGLQGPLTALLLWMIIRWTDNPDASASLAFYAAGFVVSAVAAGAAVWILFPTSGAAIRGFFKFRAFPQEKVMDTALPMLFQLAAVPVATQIGRLMLSHRSNESELVSYALGAQVYFSLQAIIATAGISLWPIFAKAGRGSSGPSPFVLSGLFLLSAGFMSATILFFRSEVFLFLSAGEANVQLPTVLAFSLSLCFQAALYPLGMFLTDREGLRFQIAPTLGMVLMTVTLCYSLAPHIGAAAPALSVGLSVAFIQLPAYCYSVFFRTRITVATRSERDL